jgi:hypothetical protein
VPTVNNRRWFATMAQRLLLSVFIVTLMTSNDAWAVLISVDLESSFTGQHQPFSGVDPEAAAADSIFNAANIWNHLGTTGFQVVNPSFQNLVDSNGINTGVSFSITGSISAFGFDNPADALLSDYICWSCRGNPDTIDWTIAGLAPSTEYVLFFNGSDSNASTPRQFSMLIDTNGNGSLADEVARTVVSPPGTLFASVFSDANGRIIGRGIAMGSEANWGGFQLARPARAVVTCPTTFDFDFSGTQYADCFRDVQRGGEINAGPDVGATNHPSLAFIGSTGSGGATWLTVYDDTPSSAAPGPTFRAETLCADVLFARFNNIKGAGVVALLNEGVGQRGLALVVSDAGNTDLLRLATVEGDPAKQGKLTILSSVPMKNGIAENVWYRLIMTVDPTTPRVTGKVFTHSTPLDPGSALGVQVGSTLTYEPAALPAGVTSPGQNGILAQAVSAVVDLSITNFSNDPALCSP